MEQEKNKERERERESETGRMPRSKLRRGDSVHCNSPPIYYLILRLHPVGPSTFLKLLLSTLCFANYPSFHLSPIALPSWRNHFANYCRPPSVNGEKLMMHRLIRESHLFIVIFKKNPRDFFQFFRFLLLLLE